MSDLSDNEWYYNYESEDRNTIFISIYMLFYIYLYTRTCKYLENLHGLNTYLYYKIQSGNCPGVTKNNAKNLRGWNYLNGIMKCAERVQEDLLMEHDNITVVKTTPLHFIARIVSMMRKRLKLLMTSVVIVPNGTTQASKALTFARVWGIQIELNILPV